MYTVDASVWVNAYVANEPNNESSVRFLKLLLDAAIPLHLPTLVITEVVASIARRTGNANVAKSFGEAQHDLPDVTWHALDLRAAHRAADHAAFTRLRGGDAVYSAVATMTSSILVTLDTELLNRSSTVVTECTPAQAIASR